MEFNKYRNLSKYIRFQTFQNNLDFNLYVVLSTSSVIVILEKGLSVKIVDDGLNFYFSLFILFYFSFILFFYF